MASFSKRGLAMNGCGSAARTRRDDEADQRAMRGDTEDGRAPIQFDFALSRGFRRRDPAPNASAERFHTGEAMARPHIDCMPRVRMRGRVQRAPFIMFTENSQIETDFHIDKSLRRAKIVTTWRKEGTDDE